MKYLLIIFFLGFSIVSKAQHHSNVFFSDMEFGHEIDTFSRSEFMPILKRHLKDFNQVLWSNGSDSPEDWELVSDSYLGYPEIIIPRVNSVDFNHDGKKDIIISFLAGHEYTFVGFYMGVEKGYQNVYENNRVFYGMYANGDVCVRHPACCDDPTNEFYRLKIDSMGSVFKLDSFSIAVSGSFVSQEDLRDNTEWTTSEDTLYVKRLHGNPEVLEVFLPGADIRKIKETQDMNGDKLVFCEIKGELIERRNYSLVLPHSFLFLSKKGGKYY